MTSPPVVPSYPEVVLAHALLGDAALDDGVVTKLLDAYGAGESLWAHAPVPAQRTAAAAIRELHARAHELIARAALADGLANEATLHRLDATAWLAPRAAIDRGCALEAVEWFFERGPLAIARYRARHTAAFVRWLERYARDRTLAPLALDGPDEVAPRSDPTREGLAYNYAIAGRIAATASSVVYRARHVPTRAEVALKVVPRTDPRMLALFRREVWATLRARGDGVVRVFDFGATPDYYYLALELLEGETLSQRLVREGPLGAPEAARIAARVAAILARIHRTGLVHGDVKPLNLMLHGDGVALIDFGCATEAGGDAPRGMGSPPYLAPEQGCGNPEGRPQRLDRRSDLYALGVSMFHMVTGTLPITNKRLENFWKWQVEDEIPRLSTVEPALAEVVYRLTRKRPDDRYGDAEEVLRALAAYW